MRSGLSLYGEKAKVGEGLLHHQRSINARIDGRWRSEVPDPVEAYTARVRNYALLEEMRSVRRARLDTAGSVLGDGQERIYVGSRTGSVSVLSQNLEFVEEFSVASPVKAIIPNGAFLVVVTSDGCIVQVKNKKGAKRRLAEGCSEIGEVQMHAYLPLLFFTQGATVLAYDLQKEEVVYSQEASSAIKAMAIHPCGSCMYLGGRGSVLVDLRVLREGISLPGQQKRRVQASLMHSSGVELVISQNKHEAPGKGEIATWDMRNLARPIAVHGIQAARLYEHRGGVFSQSPEREAVAFCPVTGILLRTLPLEGMTDLLSAGDSLYSVQADRIVAKWE